MTEVQNALLKYVKSNTYFSVFLKIDFLLAVIYPLYLILNRIPVLDDVWKYVGMVASLFYIMYLTGVIICFAENKWVPLSVALGIRAVNCIFSLKYGFSFNSLVYIAFYCLLTCICIMKATEDAQWNKLKMKTLGNVSKYAGNVNNALGNNQAPNSVCPNCGALIDDEMRFCRNCGKPVNR